MIEKNAQTEPADNTTTLISCRRDIDELFRIASDTRSLYTSSISQQTNFLWIVSLFFSTCATIIAIIFGINIYKSTQTMTEFKDEQLKSFKEYKSDISTSFDSLEKKLLQEFTVNEIKEIHIDPTENDGKTTKVSTWIDPVSIDNRLRLFRLTLKIEMLISFKGTRSNTLAGLYTRFDQGLGKLILAEVNRDISQWTVGYTSAISPEMKMISGEKYSNNFSLSVSGTSCRDLMELQEKLIESPGVYGASFRLVFDIDNQPNTEIRLPLKFADESAARTCDEIAQIEEETQKSSNHPVNSLDTTPLIERQSEE